MADSHPTPDESSFEVVLRDRRLGSYELLEEVGRGGIGVVFRARHVHLGQIVAVKLLRPDSLGGANEIRRFEREIRSVGSVDSPHVVRARDAGVVDGTHFLVMDFVDGVDVRRLVEASGPLSVANGCEVVRQALLGLRDVARRGLVHRDLKPSNLIVDRAGVVRLLDLGLARVGRSGGESELTGTGVVMGTSGFIAPEQVRDPRNVDVRADLYSLGCTLFAILTDRLPFDEPEFPSAVDRILAHLQTEPPRLAGFRDVPDELDQLGAELLRKAPERRPGTPDEVLERIAPFCAEADLPDLVPEPVHDATPRALAGGMTSTITLHDANAETETRRDSRIGEPAKRRWSRLALWSGLAVVVALAGLGGASWFGPESAGHEEGASDNASRSENASRKDSRIEYATPAATEEIPYGLDELEVGRWFDLLERPPRPLVWPDPERGSWWRHEPDFRLRVDNRTRRALFALGETYAEAYTLRIHLHQTDWTGDVGLFLGHHEAPDERGACWRAQYVRLVQNDPSAGADGFRVERGLLEIRPDFEGVLEGVPRGIASHPVQEIVGEEILELRIDRGDMTAALLGGFELDTLCTPQVNRRFAPEFYVGPLGAMTGRTTAEFRQAQFRIVATSSDFQPLETPP